MQQSESLNKMIQLYVGMNKTYSISAKDIDVFINFSDLSTTLSKVSAEVGAIAGKLNVLIPKSFDIDIVKNYETDLSDLATKICKDIASKLDDGILESIEIVHVVMGALNGITALINSKAAQLKNNSTEIKYVLTHFVLSLLILVLSTLAQLNVISKDVLLVVLKNISDQLETYRLLAETFSQTAELTGSSCSCVIC